MTTVAEVILWGTRIAAVSLEPGSEVAAFEYDPTFLASGIPVSPLQLPLKPGVHTFPALPKATFHGLPGLLSDSLPGAFGNALVDAWLAAQGRAPKTCNAVERLCYAGAHGMGALEFRPSLGPDRLHRGPIDVTALAASFARPEQGNPLAETRSVGMSAGGASAKAAIAWNARTNEVRADRGKLGRGFDPWLLKFDGDGEESRELTNSLGYGAVEYAYSEMARAAGIHMPPTHLFELAGHRHFMTKRFDRVGASKLHVQTLGALAHYDSKAGGAHGYEQAFQVLRRLGLGMKAIEELYVRMVFNVLARNRNDHVQNLAFLMDRSGCWSLSPAYDLVYSHNPEDRRTTLHQMTVAGKREDIVLDDFEAVAETVSMQRGRARRIVQRVHAAVERWTEFATAANVAPKWIATIQSDLSAGLMPIG